MCRYCARNYANYAFSFPNIIHFVFDDFESVGAFCIFCDFTLTSGKLILNKSTKLFNIIPYVPMSEYCTYKRLDRNWFLIFYSVHIRISIQYSIRDTHELVPVKIFPINCKFQIVLNKKSEIQRCNSQHNLWIFVLYKLEFRNGLP